MRKKSVYLVGIKGVAMTALAVYLKEAGWQVTGSDTEEVFLTDRILKKYKIKVLKGFDETNISPKYDLVVVTGAHNGLLNKEAQYAKKLKIPTYMHGEYLGKIFNQKTGISVAGCHGKTTTSALIASMLTFAKFDPSYTIGVASINGLGAAGHFGKGKYFVAESDEYVTCPLTDKTPRFLWQKPKILLITNIEYDHPDVYPDLTAVRNAYLDFTKNVSKEGIIIACMDSPDIQEILPSIKLPVITYGFSRQAEYQITKYYFGQEASFMRIVHNGIELGEFLLRIPGKHNIINALGAVVVLNQLGISWELIGKYLKQYTGCKRRFEKIASVGNILLYDDYAHHPSEIKATITAAKQWFPQRRIIVLFQPHTFSRTKKLFSEFTHAFVESDVAVICDIYPSAREKFDKTINSQMVVSSANKIRNNMVYAKNQEAVLTYLTKIVKDNDLLITMGAGDIFLWHKEIIKILKAI